MQCKQFHFFCSDFKHPLLRIIWNVKKTQQKIHCFPLPPAPPQDPDPDPDPQKKMRIRNPALYIHFALKLRQSMYFNIFLYVYIFYLLGSVSRVWRSLGARAWTPCSSPGRTPSSWRRSTSAASQVHILKTSPLTSIITVLLHSTSLICTTMEKVSLLIVHKCGNAIIVVIIN